MSHGMAVTWQRHAGVILWLLLGLPAVRHTLEASMTLQMAVQLPLLALAGWWCLPLLPSGFRRRLAVWNHQGVSGLVLVSLTGLLWMLPRAMDASLVLGWVEVAKFTGVPLFVGLALALSWSRAGLVVRGLFLAETIATAFRVGWIYLVTPRQLCVNYLVSDQQLLGQLFLVAGAAATLFVIWQLMWGHPAVN